MTQRRPTARQIEVAQALADGLTLRETAVRLEMAYNTARTHAGALKLRVRATNMMHVIAIGFREGWLT